ncbi:thiamine ABC transporter substrate binding subunit [Roseicitreum antarcticum]|uniref:Thiamine transport system substrate-binding protein n=1 Tax=Roseicitreum antarcticum TaxID=564137 RepID=A0A1H2QVT5_9RHOB|nr:thiamine ABC transporter substrate binding subunit [Roseicitreum antarcticum]SDW11038.1 thiamine transport system substrate-binding protein [Roseicitreum antarcticum]
MHYPIFAAGALLASVSAAAADTPVLTVYAPDYFASEWGPGPAIKQAFEAQCGCELAYSTGDVLPRILLEGARTRADVVIGLNSDVTLRARETGLFAQHGQPLDALELPVPWDDDIFLPFNWSYTAFVYDKTRTPNPPASFADLLERDDLSLVIQDPRSSISGLALLLWVDQIYGDGAAEVWAKLAPQIVTVTAGWGESYGLFTDGEADMVLSFTTSPAYHIMAEDDDTKAAAIFPEGHYFLVEVAAKLAGAAQPELADQFLDFILTDTFQDIIPTANWSYPSAQPTEDWPQEFRDLPLPETALFYDEVTAEERRGPALDAWLSGMTR